MLVHLLLLQNGAFCGHTWPHALQFLGSLRRSTSQPFCVLLSQLPNPGRHESNMHWLLTQIDFAFGMLHCGHVQLPMMQTRPCAHTLPHAPQFFTSLTVGVS